MHRRPLPAITQPLPLRPSILRAIMAEEKAIAENAKGGGFVSIHYSVDGAKSVSHPGVVEQDVNMASRRAGV